jgi:hypothetical protein
MKPRASLYDNNTHTDCDERSRDFEVRAEAKMQEYLRAQLVAVQRAASAEERQRRASAVRAAANAAATVNHDDDDVIVRSDFFDDVAVATTTATETLPLSDVELTVIDSMPLPPSTSLRTHSIGMLAAAAAAAAAVRASAGSPFSVSPGVVHSTMRRLLTMSF